MRQLTKLLIQSLVIIGIAGFASSALAGDVEAKKNGVKIYSEASKKSSVVKTLKKGETVEFVERKGMYWQVKANGGKAFVSVMDVKKAPESNSNLSDAIRSVVKDGRSTDDVAGQRSRSAVMGVRGLDEDDTVSFAGDTRPNLRSVYAMEDFTVGQAKVDKLGELVFAELEQNMGE